jgi:hypothetical protein
MEKSGDHGKMPVVASTAIITFGSTLATIKGTVQRDLRGVKSGINR